MASNTARQNANNKVGRNSGEGPGGLDEVVPTAAEARRGLEPLHTEQPAGWRRGLGLGLGAMAALGGLAALFVQRARQPRTWRDRLRKAIKR